MTELSPVVVPLDTVVADAVNAMTIAYLTELAEETTQASEADPDDDAAPDIPSVDLDDLKAWLCRACAPQEWASPCHGRLVAAAISQKLADLQAAQSAVDALIETFFSGAQFRIAMDSLVVNHPIVMEALSESGLPQGSVMLIPMEDMYEPDADEEVEENLRDIVAAVIRWNGFYLSRAVLTDFRQVTHRFDLAARAYGESVRNKIQPNVIYYQGLPH
jgi:hypothetical protein